jgi:predicted nucleic acid-binding protein
LSVYADTSFVFALYVPQANSAAATAYMATASSGPLPITTLGRFELCNAIRLAAFRKDIDKKMAAEDLQMIEKDLSSGVLTITDCDWTAVHAEAERLSAAHTLTGGHRGMDTLHVATALILGASEFRSFDKNQRRLAAAEGLTVMP